MTLKYPRFIGIKEFEVEIETLVKDRRGVLAKSAISRYLKKLSFSLDSRVRASEWYRRLGWHREAYLLIAPSNWSVGTRRSDEPDGRRMLWCARFINLLGGTDLAINLCKRITCVTAEAHRILANIYLSAYIYDDAYFHFKSFSVVDSSPDSYISRMCAIGLCDSLAGLGKINEAIEELKKIKPSPSEHLLMGIILSAEGEYKCLAEEYKGALKALQLAERFFPEETSPDHGILYKWLGLCHAKTGSIELGKEYFSKSLMILKSPQIRAEAYMETLLRMNDSDLRHDDPRHLFAYPGISIGFKNRHKYVQQPFFLPAERKSVIFISVLRDEYKIGKQYHFGIPKEIELVELLKRSGDFGIGLVRLKSLMWPDEVGAFYQLDQRIYKLIKRLKSNYKIDVKVEDSIVKMAGKSREKICVEILPDIAASSFYKAHPSFTAKQFALYYGLSKSRAHVILNEQLDKKYIKQYPTKTGQVTLFSVVI